MNNTPNDKTVFQEWSAPSRYFEKKPAHYFRATVILTILSSVLLYYLGERLLIFLAWIIFFVVYVRAVVEPPEIKFILGRFGLHFFDFYLKYEDMSYFGVVKKPHGQILRIFGRLQGGTEYNVVLPTNDKDREQIVHILKERVPYLERIPKTEIERIADWLSRLTGLS